MKNNNNQNQLLQLRSQIDVIDNQIISLLNQRMGIVGQVATYKKSINESFFIKSARESDMIKDLIKKTNPTIPKSTIVNIWRKIITSSNCLEQNLNIAIHNPNKIVDYNYLVKEYYGDFVPTTSHDSVNSVISEIEKGRAQIGVFVLPKFGQNKLDNWWINLANNQSEIKVFAHIPMIANSEHSLVAVAKKKPEQSNDDKTLLSVEITKEVSKYYLEETLKELGFEFRILQSTTLEQVSNITFYLIEILGFIDKESAIINNLSKSKIKPFIKIIGHFANPIDN
jgi:chorismate mutase